MAGVEKINYKGKTIFFADYKTCDTEDKMLAVLYQMRDMVSEHNSEYYQLSDITGCYLTPKYMDELKKIAKTIPQTAIKRATVGFDSFTKKILLKMYNLLIAKNGIQPFDDLQTAKDWLVS